MYSKKDYRASIKAARKELRNKRKLAHVQYKYEVKKHKLLLKQAQAKKGLEEMGVVNKSIPVQFKGQAHTIKVRVA